MFKLMPSRHFQLTTLFAILLCGASVVARTKESNSLFRLSATAVATLLVSSSQ
jgi:hypothetical protein